jgi:cathepsin L
VASCNTAKTTAAARIKDLVKLHPNNYTDVITHLAEKGPLAINVWAEHWQTYSSGVFDGCLNTSNVDIDHVVQLVGYGTDAKSGDYWLVRNSWGASWGEAGYIRVKRFSEDEAYCGKDTTPADGTGCSDGPSVVDVCGMCGILYDASYPIGATLANSTRWSQLLTH